LIMILCKDDELIKVHSIRVSSEVFLAMLGILSCVNITVLNRPPQVICTAKIFIVSVVLIGNQRMQGVVKLVNPLPIKAVPASTDRKHVAGVVKIKLGDQDFLSSCLVLQTPDNTVQFFHQGERTVVPYGMDGIKTKTVDPVFVQPHQSVLQVKSAHTIAPGIVKVDGLPPSGFIFVRKVGPVFLEVVPFGSLVIIDDV